jgi:hypothetical protein
MRGELTAALTTQPQTDQEKAEAVSSEANRQHDELRKKWCDELDQWPNRYLSELPAFDRKGRPLESADRSDLPRAPLNLVFDALDPAYMVNGKIINHDFDNSVPTSYFLNQLRWYYGSSLLPLVALLARGVDSDEMERIRQKLDHLYLIALQFPDDVASRGQLPADVIIAITRQHHTGIAEPDACLRITRPWSLPRVRHRFQTCDGASTPAKAAVLATDVALLEEFISDLEREFGRKLPRHDGDDSAVYLFHPSNKPVSWSWRDVSAWYAYRLRTLTRWCNRHYETTCNKWSLFALHCIQYLQRNDERNAERRMAWIIDLQEPYNRHMFRAVSAHRKHKQQMNTGFRNEEISLAAFREEGCNIDWEPHVVNMMRGEYDQFQERMWQILREDMPLGNPGFWTKEQVMAKAPELPATKWTYGVAKKKSKKSGKGQGKGGKGKKGKSKKGKHTKTTASTSAPTGQVPSNTATPAGEFPNRSNLTNEANICYASAVVQAISSVPALRALVKDVNDVTKFPFRHHTGRGPYAFLRLNDPGFRTRRDFLERLSALCDSLESHTFSDTPAKKLPPDATLGMMAVMRRIKGEFTINEEHDTAPLLYTIVEILNEAGDKSAHLSSDFNERPNSVHTGAEEQKIKQGQPIMPLREDLAVQRINHRAAGYDSSVTTVVNLQFVQESVCSRQDKGCTSPFARSFHSHNFLVLGFPIHREGFNPQDSYTVHDLVDIWAHPKDMATCEYIPCRSRAKEAVRKIVGLPDVLIVQINRLTLGEGESQSALSGKNIESIEGFIGNPLIVDESIDLSEYCERELPTEKAYGGDDERLPKQPKGAKYKLRALIKWRGGHFFTYALTPDDNGALRWCRMDDVLSRVVWESPFSASQTGRGYDFMFFYERADPKTGQFMTVDERFAVKGPSAAKAAEVVEITSGEESSSSDDEDEDEGDGTSEEDYDEEYEDSDDEDRSDEASDEDESMHDEEDRSSNESDEMDEDEPGKLIAIASRSLTYTNENSLEDADIGLASKAQAQAIADAFRDIAKSLDGDVKAKLLENASKVTVLGSKLALELQRRQQEEVSASPDVKMEDIGEDVTGPVYKEAVDFARDANTVSKFLEEHNFELFRGFQQHSTSPGRQSTDSAS